MAAPAAAVNAQVLQGLLDLLKQGQDRAAAPGPPAFSPSKERDPLVATTWLRGLEAYWVSFPPVNDAARIKEAMSLMRADPAGLVWVEAEQKRTGQCVGEEGHGTGGV